VISFYYGSYTARHRIGTYIERFDQVVSNPAGCVPTQSTVINEYEITVQRLDSIKAAAHTIKFTTALRSDALHPTSGAQQERRIDKIIVTTPTGTVLRQFLFDHDYFSGNRLRLRNVYEQDPSGASLPPYSFTYDGQSLPAIASNAQDHWGYHNGKTNSSLIPPAVTPSGAYLTGADRSPDPTKMRMGILTKITYPTGGYNEFVYEANDYGAIGHFATAPTDSGPKQPAQRKRIPGSRQHDIHDRRYAVRHCHGKRVAGSGVRNAGGMSVGGDRWGSGFQRPGHLLPRIGPRYLHPKGIR
jgi:hypothetical protein